MAPSNLSFIQAENHLILTVPETEFKNYLSEANKLVQREPEILERIEQDLEQQARLKKQKRLEDRQWEESQNPNLPFCELAIEKRPLEELSLQSGRTRMSGFVVYIFLMIRGYLGGIKSQSSQVFLKESMSLHLFLENRGLKMPGMSTILDHINAVSNQTRQFIFDAQIRMIIGEDLDDFDVLKLDSTAVTANSAWPTDSSLMSRLAERLYHRGNSLDKFGLRNIHPRNFEHLIKEMKSLSKRIAFEVGKKGSQKRRKKHYRQLLKFAQKFADKFLKELQKVDFLSAEIQRLPSQKARLIRLIEMMHQDIENLEKIIDYCAKRVFENKSTSSDQKVLSLSDQDAAYIQKGNREPVIGYKPQLGRSQNGFVSTLIVPEGNANDAGQLDECIEDHVRRTERIPQEISVDDGYANQAIRKKWQKKGVSLFSISGAKGKKIISEEEYNSPVYQDSRNGRSAVESLMFTIKHGFDFGEVMRRGIENVRAELMEKVMAYNFCRTIELRRKKLKLAA